MLNLQYLFVQRESDLTPWLGVLAADGRFRILARSQTGQAGTLPVLIKILSIKAAQ